MASRRLDEDEKDRATITTLGGPQEAAIINESGPLQPDSNQPEGRREAVQEAGHR